MSSAFRAYVRAAALAFAGFGAMSHATNALAACGMAASSHPASWQREGSAGAAQSLLHEAALGTPGRIVGMWSFQMSANGAQVDFGYQQWHSDGTELMNSGGRPPATENFCMGVWKQVGTNGYHLNHFALSYDSSGNLNAKVNIKEDVAINATGTSYSGPFTLDVYDPKTNALLQHVVGQVTAQRVPAN